MSNPISNNNNNNNKDNNTKGSSSSNEGCQQTTNFQFTLQCNICLGVCGTNDFFTECDRPLCEQCYQSHVVDRSSRSPFYSCLFCSTPINSGHNHHSHPSRHIRPITEFRAIADILAEDNENKKQSQLNASPPDAAKQLLAKRELQLRQEQMKSHRLEQLLVFKEQAFAFLLRPPPPPPSTVAFSSSQGAGNTSNQQQHHPTQRRQRLDEEDADTSEQQKQQQQGVTPYTASVPRGILKHPSASTTTTNTTSSGVKFSKKRSSTRRRIGSSAKRVGFLLDEEADLQH